MAKKVKNQEWFVMTYQRGVIEQSFPTLKEALLHVGKGKFVVPRYPVNTVLEYDK